jgi:TonB family protein
MPKSEKSSIPEVSAPQLAPIHSSQPREKAPAREKLSKMMEQLLGEVKVPNLKSSPATPLSQQPALSPPSTRPVQSEIDRQIAKLSIPSVTPVESIKKRLQLLEVQSSSNPGDSSSQPSSGKNHYLAMVEDKIDHQWVAPPLVASAPVVVLKFRISRSGEISNIHIDESSGNSHYDSAAQRAVHAVNPLPPFPPDISESSFEVRFRFIKKD